MPTFVARVEDDEIQRQWQEYMSQFVFDANNPIWDWQGQLSKEDRFTLKFARLYDSCFGDSLGTTTSRYIHLVKSMERLLDQVRLLYRNPENPVQIREGTDE